mmetsp:Transcript_41264/g.76777  ORF Transcript_41264/g.76777 Transcript_41264/m.76777 type:complete len:208 (+) Transcript_41264:324-947(+)
MRCVSRSANSMVLPSPSARTLGSPGPPSHKGCHTQSSRSSGKLKFSIGGSSSSDSSKQVLFRGGVLAMANGFSRLQHGAACTFLALAFRGFAYESFSPPVNTSKVCVLRRASGGVSASRNGLFSQLAPCQFRLDKSPSTRLGSAGLSPASLRPRCTSCSVAAGPCIRPETCAWIDCKCDMSGERLKVTKSGCSCAATIKQCLHVSQP